MANEIDTTDGLDSALEEYFAPQNQDTQAGAATQEPLTEPAEGASPTEQPKPSEAYLELDGKRYTVKELKELLTGSLRYKDYTKKTQLLSDERKKWAKEQGDSKKALERLKRYEQLDDRLSSNPEAIEALKKYLSPQSQVPPEMLERIEALEGERVDKQIDKELQEVCRITGDLSPEERDAFLAFAEEYQNKVEGVIPLTDLAHFYPQTREKIAARLSSSKANEEKKRTENKAKTKSLPGSKGAATPPSGDYNSQLRAEVESMFGK